MKNAKLTKYVFILGSFLLVSYLAINTNKDKLKETSEIETLINKNENQINQHDFSLTSEDLNKKQNETIFSENKFDNKHISKAKMLNNKDIPISKNILVNSIKITKDIDRDKLSDTYREPINAFQTITTLDKNITKEIDYYPSFYIWSSINTENVELHQIIDNTQDNTKIIKPIELLMSIKCGDQLIKELEYQVSARTPRWREWIQIDLSDFEEKTLKGIWNVQIINLENKETLESRNFQLKQNVINNAIEQTAELINN